MKIFNILVSFVCLPHLACSSNELPSGQESQTKVVNGQETADNPYVVSLVWGGQSGCTGTLIRDNVVLTAGHCIDDRQLISPPDWVEVGAVVGQPQNTQSAVAGYHVEPRWNLNQSGNYNYDYDIALIFLQAPIRGLAIPYSSLSPSSLIGQTIRAIGYGVDNGFQQSGAGIKRTVDLTIRSADTNYFIASWLEGQPQDTCQGDSGGPALYLNNGRYEVLGVVSNGPNYCQGSTRYTTANDHRDFLSNTISTFERNGVQAFQEVGDVITPDRGSEIYNCGLIFECATRCPDDACQQDCADRATEQARNHLMELNNCDFSYRCDSDLTCMSDNCPTQLDNCGFTPMPSSTDPNEERANITTCEELMNCENACGSANDPDTCVERCYRSVTDTQAISDLNRLQSCASNSDCSDDACVMEVCQNELIACGYEEDSNSNTGRTDPPRPNQGQSCTEVWNCLTECVDEACVQSCYFAGTELASNQAYNLVVCFSENESFINEFEDLYIYCPEETDTCFESY